MWTESEHEILHRILEALIPASKDGKIPSANKILIIEKLKQEAIKDNKFKSLLLDGLKHIRQMLNVKGKDLNSIDFKKFTTLICKLEDQKPEFFNAFLRKIYIAYYNQPSIRTHFGLSANPPHPDGYNVPSETIEEISSLVAPVIKKGACYRI